MWLSISTDDRNLYYRLSNYRVLVGSLNFPNQIVDFTCMMKFLFGKGIRFNKPDVTKEFNVKCENIRGI